MNKHWVWGLAVLLTLPACSRSTQLAVRAVSEGPDGEATGRAQLVIRMLSYNRDSIFDALAARAPAPEPEPPADLLELRDSVSLAQQRWRAAEASWNDVRSEMQRLSEQMQRMDRSSTEYFRAYQRFEELDAQVGGLDRTKTVYFNRFTELDSLYRARADSFTAVHLAWGDAAFENYNQITDSLVELLGEELWDTTATDGWAYFAVPRGMWWIYTRFELPFEELYWNVTYESVGGADTVILNNSNAEVRPLF